MKLLIEIQKARDGRDYVQILSEDAVSVNIVLIAEEIKFLYEKSDTRVDIQTIKRPKPKLAIIGKQEKDYDRKEVYDWFIQHDEQMQEFWVNWLKLEKSLCYDDSLDCIEELRGFRLKWQEVLG